jgi:hypothetical protein
VKSLTYYTQIDLRQLSKVQRTEYFKARVHGWRPLWMEARGAPEKPWRLTMHIPSTGDRIRILPNGAVLYCLPWRSVA